MSPDTPTITNCYSKHRLYSFVRSAIDNFRPILGRAKFSTVLGWFVSYTDAFYMVTRKLKISEKAYLKRLGKKVSKIILQEKGYSSLDAFWLENDTVPKGTLYEICNGTRDFKLTTFLRLASALGMKPTELLLDEH